VADGLGNRLEVVVLLGAGAGRSMQVRSLSKTNEERFVGSWDPLDGGVWIWHRFEFGEQAMPIGKFTYCGDQIFVIPPV
jgi:hypothetical protein